MNPFSSLNPKQVGTLKTIGLGLAALTALGIVIRLPGSPLPAAFPLGRNSQTSGSAGSYAYDTAMPPYAAKTEEAAGLGGVSLSARNIAPAPPGMPAPMVPGTDAEAFEAASYHGTIETRDLARTCGAIAGWKTRPDVIFEQANESERACSYVFKVANAQTDDILGRLKALNPKELTENTQTIKRTINDFTSETEILTKKQESIEKTLESAIRAYDEISGLATRTQDAASLTRVIDSKIQVIERLTQERLAVIAQLDRLARAKAEQLDRVDYTYFSMNVYENKYFDGQRLKESWQAALRDFVRDVNAIAQSSTLGLAALLLLAGQYVLYAVILVVIAKYVWRFVRWIWKA